MKRPKNGATIKQYAYAKKLLNADGPSKKDIALSVGYSPSVASNVMNNIEKTEGFHNAVVALAAESNNLVMGIMAEYKARGFTDFSNKDLNGALNAIGTAWDKFNKASAMEKNQDPSKNRLKAVILNRIENQTINNVAVSPQPDPATAPSPTPHPAETEKTPHPTTEDLDL